MSPSKAGLAGIDDMPPTFSVIIPAYNQAAYLREALESVFAQTLTDYEVVVVNDGSTDDTEAVIATFADRPRLQAVSQENQGLAAARNTGIDHARGTYVALLDADDSWQPHYLAEVHDAITRHPEADAFYCAARMIDADGRALPQLAGATIVPPAQLFSVLLRANFLIPSAVVVKRSSLALLGLFDVKLRPSGVEDRDMWLRMLQKDMVFIGIPGAHVRYRTHGASLSANVAGMQQAAQCVIEKHFGRDDKLDPDWPAVKRAAFGGHYAYLALSSLLYLGDQAVGARFLRRALEVDPTLAEDKSLFYELALGQQPLGYRGTEVGLDPMENGRVVEDVLAQVFAAPVSERLAALRSTASATAYRKLAKVARLAGDMNTSRHFALRAIAARRRQAFDADWWRIFVRTFVPSPSGPASSTTDGRITTP